MAEQLPGATPQSLVTNDELCEAIRAWLDVSDSQSRRPDTAFNRHWRGSRLTVLEYARQRRGDLSDFLSDKSRLTLWNMLASYDEPLELATAQARHQAIASRVQKVYESPTQLAFQVMGLLAGVQAAHAMRNWRAGQALPADFGSYVGLCLDAYQRAWPLRSDVQLDPQAYVPGKELDNAPRSAQALAKLVQSAGRSFPVSTFLTVRRLLGYLLNEDEPAVSNQHEDAPFEVETRVLYAVERNVGGQTTYDGFVGALRVRAYPEFQSGCYLDPVQLGLVQVDESMLKSLELAWRRVEPELHAHDKQGRSKSPSPSLRVAPAIPASVVQLRGGSAGAIFVCALYAAGKREGLNRDVTATIGLDPDSATTDGSALIAIDLRPVSADSMDAKLQAAARAGLRRVVLHTAQVASGGDITPPEGLEVVRADSLAKCYQWLTGNARLDRVLEHYSDKQVDNWTKAWTRHNRQRLLYYVPPTYWIERRKEKAKKGNAGPARAQSTPNRQKCDLVYLPTEEQTLAKLLELGGSRLCIANAPGAGKTIFTRRLLAYASSPAGRDALADGKPLLAVRWEERSLDGSWPEKFSSALGEAVLRFCKREGVTSKDVVDWALQQGRVLLILDALDQVDAPRIEAFQEFLALVERRGWKIRIVVTGRPFAVDENRRLLNDRWRFGGILPFTPRKQHRYLRGPRTTPQSTANPDAWRSRDLRGCEIRRLVEALERGSDQDAVLTSLRDSFFSNYDQVRRLLSNPDALHYARILAEEGELAGVRSRTELYLKTCRENLRNSAEKVLKRRPSDDEMLRWEEILAAAGFQTMADGPGHFRLEGLDRVASFKRNVSRRCAQPVTPQEWSDLNRITSFHSRTIVREASDAVWAWPDRRMVEFYCGLHLARNNQPGWLRDDKGSKLRCGDETLQAHAGDPQWHEPFLHALQMPEEVRDDNVLVASLAELFQPDAGAKTGNLRPTELMYRAWCLLEELPGHERAQPSPKLLVGGERVISAFRAQFQRQLADAGEQGRVARELDGDFLPVPALENEELALTKPHRISLSSFLLGRTVVTREQYSLFDESYLKLHEKEIQKYEDRSLRCGAQRLSWYDAWCAARYFGGRLPTEAEWEYACGAGSRTDCCRIKTSDPAGYRDLESWTELALVADIDRPRATGPRAVDEGRDLPDGTRRRLLPNAFGLLGMHGGLWEWCVSWYGGSFAPTSLAGPEVGSGRVNRGGSWFNAAVHCRLVDRGRCDPSVRGATRGFRLARVR
jgi:sulfatase modifying factor 1